MLLLAAFAFFCFILGTEEARGQSTDDHGDDFHTATPLALGASVAGRIDPGDDRDFFRLDLSGASGTTGVWIYTTGDLDTLGTLYDVEGNLLVLNDDGVIAVQEWNFHLRRRVPSGVYYVEVRSYGRAVGDYALHAEEVTDPGSTARTATPLSLDSPTPGSVDAATDADYFRLDLAGSRNLVIYTVGLYLEDAYGPLPADRLDTAVLDSGGTEISVNMRYYSWSGVRIADDFGPGSHYVKVTVTGSDATYPVPYTIHAYEDTGYTDFINDCEASTVSLNNPQIDDPLYGCQWHLSNRDAGGKDINVEPLWAAGVNGQGVNIAVVDDTMDYSHEDLAGNVNSSLSHDFGGRGGEYRPFEHHGTAVAGIIAARDNHTGVRGVAPRATIYGYNYLSGYWWEFEALYEAEAMARNRGVTGVSNNSWGPPDGPWLSHAPRLWELAVNSGTREGYGGRGVFYAFAAGNGNSYGDNSNLDEYTNYYATTAVCAVNDQDTRSDYSEIGSNLWVCAPSDDLRQGYRGIVTTENSDRYNPGFGGTSAATPIVSGWRPCCGASPRTLHGGTSS